MENEQTFACCFEDETNNIEQEIMNDGVNFFVKYIGAVEIFQSMKLLDFSLRSQVAREGINKVLDFANLKSPKKTKAEKRVQNCVSSEPCLGKKSVLIQEHKLRFFFTKKL